jgi:hypothetical protein
MKRLLHWLGIPVVVLAVSGCASTSAEMEGMATPRAAESRTAEVFRQSMRKLWSDHVVWTRQYIVAAAQNDPSAEAAAARLLQNQVEIGDAIEPYYGAAAGDRLTNLLQDHIRIAVDLVAAAKAGDATRQSDANTRWHRNADEIATFLSSANPNWPRETLVNMLHEHLALTTQEATARLQRRWQDDVSTFDRVVAQALSLADALSEGIIQQHPQRF